MSDPMLNNPFCDVDRKLAVPWLSSVNSTPLFGVSVDLLLFGILTVQIYVYYLAFPKDRRPLKLAAVWVYLVGVAQTVLAVVDLSGAFNDLCGSFGTVRHFSWTVIVSSTAVALPAQWLYAYRIYIISRKLWILILVVGLSLGQLGTSIEGCRCLWASGGFTALLPGVSQSGVCAPAFGWIWGPLNLSCDATITVSMSILLLKRRKDTLKKTTHAHITRVVRLVVETNLATSIVVVLYTLMYNLTSITPSLIFSGIWVIPGLTMGKVYSNSMLALLNSRLTIVGGRNAGDPFGISDIRSEVLRTEVGEGPTTDAITRRRTLRPGGPGSG